ncbi:ZIP family metal transporter [Halorubellus sp. JP-L1]|uniref:ZIP family metal transporter n=1 Tax=Halorubellus sp. JP-L1 TaxID=2715753 RepID=UPI00140B5B28|nr:ZIP family metal transporter [Halorubellus sp. JP-L1]NHN41315.1 ZIP family metal transporter [Halorubellus sp. JP-L1]
MVANAESRFNNLVGVPAVAVLAVAAFLALTAWAVTAALDGRPELWKVVGIAWTAFVAMAVAIPLGARADSGHAHGLVWAYGLAAGAMVTSAAVFLLPQAFGLHPRWGGFGVASGIVLGFGAHTVGHRLTHETNVDHTSLEISAHALAAGAIIGIVYGNMPTLGAFLGVAIVSHKGPAGYAAARRLAANDGDPRILLLPAAGVGLTAIPASIVALPPDPVPNALVFGFAAGVFLHVAMDFLPTCEIGGDVYDVAHTSDHAHELLDSLRLHAVASTGFGGLVVFVAWSLVA